MPAALQSAAPRAHGNIPNSQRQELPQSSPVTSWSQSTGPGKAAALRSLGHMPKSNLSFCFKRPPALAASALLLLLIALWADSNFHLRRFIFLPGGDVGLGFRSTSGSLQWIEHANWQPTPAFDFVVWSIPYWILSLVTFGFLVGYVLWIKKCDTQPSTCCS